MAEAIQLDFMRTGREPGGKASPQPTSSPDSIETVPAPDAAAGRELDPAPPQYALERYYEADDLAAEVLRNKYLAPGESGPWDLWKRQAAAMASVEPSAALRVEWEAKFLQILEDFRFVPGGRIMHGAGRNDIKTTLNNCYVVGIKDDSIGAIYQAVIDEAMTYKFGGGCGHDLSGLRPSGSPILGTGGESCGPTGFMDLFSTNTNTIAQHGRRGANMQTLRVDHPDIEKFVEIKRSLDKVKYSNISVLLTHEFMQAVADGGELALRWGGRIYRRINARELWQKIISAAHASAEPGLIFWDTMRDYHNGEYCSPLLSTNPCAEQPLPDGGCCNLGSINLERFVDLEDHVDMDAFTETVRTAIRFLDNVVDYNRDRHALTIQRENALADRRVGLGILGLGDMLIRMKIRFDSEAALETVETVMRAMRDTAYETSIDLAKERGAIPNFDWEGLQKSKFIQALPDRLRSRISEHGLRNITILTVPPTGSGAIVAQVTSGIEPIFATTYSRRVKKNDEYGDTFDEYEVVHPLIRKLFGTDKKLPEYVVTAHEIDPYFRVRMQAVVQRYVDSSISSTVNLPSDVSVETVGDIYMAAYREGLKGITVYRESSREGILKTRSKADPAAAEGSTASDPDGEDDQILFTHPELHPRIRPEETNGYTRRIRTGEGSLYITINRDEKGLCEVFTTIGKAGGNAQAQAEALSRLISLALRCGIDAWDIVKQLRGISGPTPTWENGHLILSTPDAIGQALTNYLNREQPAEVSTPQDKGNGELQNGEGGNGHLRSPPPNASVSAHAGQIPSGPASGALPKDANGRLSNGIGTSGALMACPDCGGTILHESGCATCPSCGFSKC